MSIIKSLSVALSAAAIVIGLAGYSYTSAGNQDAAPESDTTDTFVSDQDVETTTEVGDAADVVDDRFYQSGQRFQFANPRKQSAYQKAMETLKESESDEDREKAIATIREELEKQYDEFLKQNEKELEQMQERLNKLRSQLERRRRAKDRMVELRLETVIGEAEGLIWPSDRRPNAFWRVTPPAATVPAAPGQLYNQNRFNLSPPAAVPAPNTPLYRSRRSDRTR